MQVSWIDPADVAALAENLLRSPQKSKQPASDGAELEKVQAEAQIPPEGLFHSEEVEAVAVPVHGTETSQDHPVIATDDDEYVDEDVLAPAPVPVSGVSSPNLGAFRERLRAIREQAIGAGLLSSKAGSSPATSSEGVSASEPKPTEEIRKPQPFAAAAKEGDGKPVRTVAQRLESFTHWASECVGSDEILVVGDQGDLLWGRHAQSELILSTLMARNAASRTTALYACGDPTPHHHPLASGKTLTVIPCETRFGLMQIAVSTVFALPVEASNRLREALVSAMNAES